MRGFAQETVVVILGGGKGERLLPLTEMRAKPAVPFSGRHRIVDFPLSNAVNSGLRKILLILATNAPSAIQHANLGWNIFHTELGEYCRVLTPRQGIYAGTADAVFQNSYHLEAEEPRYVLIVSGDQIYKMDYSVLLAYHSSKEADLTISALETEDIELARRSGVLEIDEEGRVIGFEEKPSNPKPMLGAKKYLISMGIYCFNSGDLIRGFAEDSLEESSNHDFGKDIIPGMVRDEKKSVYAFLFRKENNEPGYWLDIGTIDSYYVASMGLLEVNPDFNLYDQNWPWRTYQKQLPPTKVVFEADIRGSIICEGCVIDVSEITRSILSPGVKIGKGVIVIDSIVMNGVAVGDGSVVKRAIVDKENVISAGSIIQSGNMRYEGRYETTASGIVIIPRHHAEWKGFHQ